MKPLSAPGSRAWSGQAPPGKRLAPVRHLMQAADAPVRSQVAGP